MPIVVHTDQDAQYIGLESQTIQLPTITKFIHLIPADTAIINLRLQGSFFLQQLCRCKKHVAATKLFYRIATFTILITTAVGDGIALEQDHTIFFQVDLRSMHRCIFLYGSFCDLGDHQGAEPCQCSLFQEVSSGIFHG